jgi:hypothetical protein
MYQILSFTSHIKDRKLYLLFTITLSCFVRLKFISPKMKYLKDLQCYI